MAEQWIADNAAAFERGKQANFAITRKPNLMLIGSIGMMIEAEHAHAELGY